MKPCPASGNCPTEVWPTRGDLYTAEEAKRSPAYNEALPRGGCQDGVRVRLHGSNGFPLRPGTWVTLTTRMAGGFANRDGHGAGAPHPGSSSASARRWCVPRRGPPTLTDLLDNPRIGVVHLDRRGRILDVNDRARDILRNGDGLSDREGTLRARAPADQVRLERLLGDALPASNAAALGGSMLLRRSSVLPPFVVHVKPVAAPQPDYGARHVAALILIAEPGHRHRIKPEVVATTLELTPGETQVAVWLAEGRSVREMARATRRTEGAIYQHLKQIYRKQSISRQADLVRLVLSLAE